MASRARSHAQRLTVRTWGRQPRSRTVAVLGAAALALGLAACGSSDGGAPGGPAGVGSTPVSATTAEATISLSVALQPPHLSENIRLRVGGAELATWTSDSKKPSGVLTLNGVLEGDHAYELQGTYSFYNAKGLLEQKPVHGSGTFTAANNGYYTVIYDQSSDTYTIQRLR